MRQSAAPTTRSTSSTMTARCCRSTTRCIWFRSANICRSRTASSGSASCSSPRSQADLFLATAGASSPCRGRQASLPLICYEIIFPGAACRQASAPAGCSISPMTAGSDIERRPLSALPAGAHARDRGRPAAGARRQYRHICGGRSARPHRAVVAARQRGRARRPIAAGYDCGNSLCTLWRFAWPC